MVLAGIIILGLLVGSFINAVVWRLHAGKSIVWDRSQCPNCSHKLAPIDLIPVLSWLALRGRCRYCHQPISPQYPLVEALTAVLFVLSYARLQPVSHIQWLSFGFWLYWLSALIILAVYDLRWYLLPDQVLLPAIGVGVVRAVYLGISNHSPSTTYHLLAAGLAAGGLFYALAAVSKGKWMGGGDIKLVALMGLILGPSKTVVAMILAFNSAAIVGLVLIGLKRKKRADHIPFGPFLVAGTIAAMLYAQSLISWYLHLSGI